MKNVNIKILMISLLLFMNCNIVRYSSIRQSLKESDRKKITLLEKAEDDIDCKETEPIKSVNKFFFWHGNYTIELTHSDIDKEIYDKEIEKNDNNTNNCGRFHTLVYEEELTTIDFWFNLIIAPFSGITKKTYHFRECKKKQKDNITNKNSKYENCSKYSSDDIVGKFEIAKCIYNNEMNFVKDENLGVNIRKGGNTKIEIITDKYGQKRILYTE